MLVKQGPKHTDQNEDREDANHRSSAIDGFGIVFLKPTLQTGNADSNEAIVWFNFLPDGVAIAES